MSRPILAIHISAGAVTALLLNAGLKRSAIDAWAHIVFDSSGTDDPLAAALKELKQRVAIGEASLAISIPADQVFFRALTVPFKDLKKIAQILPFELEPTLPVPVETLEIDFQAQITGESAEIVAAAVDRQYLARLMETFAQAGFKPELIVPGTYPLAHALWSSGQPLPDHYVWLDLDGDKATLLAMIQKNICLARSFSLDAGAAERTPTLVLKIQQTLTALAELRSIDYAPAQLYVSGLAEPDTLDVKELGQSLAIPVQPVDLPRIVGRLDSPADEIEAAPCTFDAALALALLEAGGDAVLCFHRSGSALRSLWSSYKRYLKPPAILLTLLVAMALGGVLLDNYLLQSRMDRIENQITTVFTSVFPDTTRIVDPLVQMQTRMDEFKKNRFDPTQTGEQVRCIDILYQISKSIPDETDVVLNRMSYGSDGITVAGETAGFNTVEDIKSRLEKSDLFSKVTIAAANMDKLGNKVLFRLKIDL